MHVLFFVSLFCAVWGYNNPVLDVGFEFGGVSVEKYDNYYYLVTPINGTVYMRLSPDLQSWSIAPPILSETDRPVWMTFFNSKIENVDLYIDESGRFFLYFSTSYPYCIGVATSRYSLGPYSISTEPLLCSIDSKHLIFDYPNILKDNGQLIMYYQHVYNDRNFNHERRVDVRNLTSDGLGVATEEGLTILRPDQPYNNLIVSSSRVFKKGNSYYMIYNSDCGSGLFVARSSSPYGPFERQGNVTLVGSAPEDLLPRLMDVIADSEGNDVILYDTTTLTIKSPYCGGGEKISAKILQWKSDDWPYVLN